MPTTVYFATNRVLTGAPDDVASYSAGIQPPSDSSGLVFGTAFVDGVDIENDVQGRITSLQNTSTGAFAKGVADDLAQGGQNLLVFFHGFDNSFEDAVTRAAFNREFLAASGNPAADTKVIAFCWPSLGEAIDFPDLSASYFTDQGMASQSGIHIMSFLSGIAPILKAARAAGRRSYLLAHSMGHVALQGAVQNWFLHGNRAAPLFHVAVLAAGDCDYDVFGLPAPNGLSALSRLSRRICTYFSGTDLVVHLSHVVNGFPRLGEDGPRNLADRKAFPAAVYRTFDASLVADYETGFQASHQYYRRSPTVRAQIAKDLAGP